MSMLRRLTVTYHDKSYLSPVALSSSEDLLFEISKRAEPGGQPNRSFTATDQPGTTSSPLSVSLSRSSVAIAPR
jgi:hypothetical protein